MSRMSDERELSEEFKLSARTVIEVFQVLNRLEGALLRHRELRFFHKGKWKDPTQSAVVSAILLQVGEMPEAEQLRMLAAGLKMLNAITTGHASPNPESPGAPPTPPDVGMVPGDLEPPPPPRRRKRQG